ncbi:MAG: hypothetical protein HYX21_00055 [Candidatus Yanofskybacteria bacterium]|nr:hypothetical protein [Candidatus Yanofskybacteria bacterium]
MRLKLVTYEVIMLVILSLLALTPVSVHGARRSNISVSFLTPGYEDGVYFVEQGGSYVSRVTGKLPDNTVFGVVVRFNNGPEIVVPNWQIGAQKINLVPSNCPLGDYTLTEIFTEQPGYRETLWLGAMTIRVVAMGSIPNSARGNGNSLIIPDFGPGQAPTNVVGLRYHVRVDQNQTEAMQIIFAGNTLYSPGNPKSYNLEYNIFSSRIVYQDNICTTYPPVGQVVDGEASLRLNFSDYNLEGRFGGKTSDPKVLPRQRILIDGIANLQALGMIPQASMNGKDITVEVTRGSLVTDKSGWKLCSGEKLGDEAYRMWNLKAAFERQSYTATFALPADGTEYFRDLFGIWTEFLSNPGYWRVFYWAPEFIREESSLWEPINNWRVIYNFGGSNNTKGFGFRLASYKGWSAIEVSNDETETYMKAGETLMLNQLSVAVLPGKK